jgi:deoxyribonuclease V
MIFAADVQYHQDYATAAGILFGEWSDPSPVRIIRKVIRPVAEYESGAFYKRELPCLLALLAEVTESLAAIVIDGYVTLGDNGHPGLGYYLYQALHQKIPVIGVAKSYFQGTPDESRVFRGGSGRPLFVTSIGIPLEEARNHILRMDGRYRLPALLKLTDQLCRSVGNQ